MGTAATIQIIIRTHTLDTFHSLCFPTFAGSFIQTGHIPTFQLRTGSPMHDYIKSFLATCKATNRHNQKIKSLHNCPNPIEHTTKGSIIGSTSNATPHPCGRYKDNNYNKLIGDRVNTLQLLLPTLPTHRSLGSPNNCENS